MSEFILDHGGAKGRTLFRALDSFTQGYVEAMFFTDTGTGDDEENGLQDATVEELAPCSVAAIVADCAAWQAANEALLSIAYQDDYDEEQAGRDYWYTRNGHGVGFWDRKQLESYGPGSSETLGDRLSDACRYSEKYVYRGDDGLIYCD
jgi:hypothetical protein